MESFAAQPASKINKRTTLVWQKESLVRTRWQMSELDRHVTCNVARHSGSDKLPTSNPQAACLPSNRNWGCRTVEVASNSPSVRAPLAAVADNPPSSWSGGVQARRGEFYSLENRVPSKLSRARQ